MKNSFVFFPVTWGFPLLSQLARASLRDVLARDISPVYARELVISDRLGIYHDSSPGRMEFPPQQLCLYTQASACTIVISSQLLPRTVSCVSWTTRVCLRAAAGCNKSPTPVDGTSSRPWKKNGYLRRLPRGVDRRWSSQTHKSWSEIRRKRDTRGYWLDNNVTNITRNLGQACVSNQTVPQARTCWVGSFVVLSPAEDPRSTSWDPSPEDPLAFYLWTTQHFFTIFDLPLSNKSFIKN